MKLYQFKELDRKKNGCYEWSRGFIACFRYIFISKLCDLSRRTKIQCDKGALGTWNYETWGPTIYNLEQSRTKCKLFFSNPEETFVNKIQSLPKVSTGDGLYEVSHSYAEINYTAQIPAKEALKQTEYRFAGTDPNNYIMFNNELWRIIGLVNTPEGQRVKIIRKKYIGGFSWDTSDSSINSGFGINEWSQSKLKVLLNEGAYYNRENGICHVGNGNATAACDFSEIGLHDFVKEMIDTITWNTGSQGTADNSLLNPTNMYNYERSKNSGKICSMNNRCNDTVVRTVTWVGQVGLMYPSDYGYATIGSTSKSREACLETSMYSWGGK